MIYKNYYLLFISSFIISFIAFKSFIPFLEQNKLLDYPIERSAHKKPVPTGGGIIFSSLSSIFSLIFSYFSNIQILSQIVIFSIPLTLLSFIDDFKNIKIRYRLLGQIITSIFLVNDGNIFNFSLNFLDLNIFFFLILVSMTTINMSNFMDGLDGLLAGCMFLIIVTSSFYLNIISPILLIILGSIFCFLFFNIYPAKIFMGDVGSIFLGCLYSGIIFQATDIKTFFALLFLASPLYVDIIVTIIRRYFDKKNIFLAHKEFLFQRLHQAGWKQYNVSSLYIFSIFVICISLIYFDLLGELIASLIFILIGYYLDKKHPLKFLK